MSIKTSIRDRGGAYDGDRNMLSRLASAMVIISGLLVIFEKFKAARSGSLRPQRDGSNLATFFCKKPWTPTIGRTILDNNG